MSLRQIIKTIKSVQIVYSLEKNPMMKGDSVPHIIEQSMDFKDILKAHERYKGDSHIIVRFRIKK